MPENWDIKKYVPWLAEFDGADRLEPMAAHTANQMLVDLQVYQAELRQREPSHLLVKASLDDIKGVVAALFIGKENKAAAIGLTPFDLEERSQSARVTVEADAATRWQQPTTQMASSAETEAAKFATFVHTELGIRYPDIPREVLDKTAAEFIAAYDEDHGHSLFNRNATMRPMTFSGKAKLSEGLKKEYEFLLRTFDWGVDSWRAKRSRLQNYAKAEFVKQMPEITGEELTAKIHSEDYGHAIEAAFAKMEKERTVFARFARETIVTQTDIIPDDRLRSYQVVMWQYDTDHQMRAPSRLLAGDESLYKLVVTAYGKRAAGGYEQGLREDGSGRKGGPRDHSPRPRGPTELD